MSKVSKLTNQNNSNKDIESKDYIFSALYIVKVKAQYIFINKIVREYK